MNKEDVHTHVHIYIYPLYIYIHVYYSATNKNEILPFLSYVDGPREYYGKWNKRVKDKYGLISLICGIWKQSSEY